jgi:DNA-binding response OmpR family regulator
LVATSGADALQLFASHPVDLVLLDYHMLGMNGDVVAEQMKTGEPDVPIALLSADDGLSESALKWVDAFVSKSESPANLLQIVEHLLDLRYASRWFNWRPRKTRSIKQCDAGLCRVPARNRRVRRCPCKFSFERLRCHPGARGLLSFERVEMSCSGCLRVMHHPENKGP